MFCEEYKFKDELSFDYTGDIDRNYTDGRAELIIFVLFWTKGAVRNVAGDSELYTFSI